MTRRSLACYDSSALMTSWSLGAPRRPAHGSGQQHDRRVRGVEVARVDGTGDAQRPPGAHRLKTPEEERPPDRALSSTAARPIHQIRQAADDSRGFNHRFSFLTPIPSSLADTNRLVVSVRPYVVEAASSFALNPGLRLPPASTGHCDDQRRVPPPARFLSASWRTPRVIDDEHPSGVPEPVGDILLQVIAYLVRTPAGAAQEVLQPRRSRVAGMLGQLPAVLPPHGLDQAVYVAQTSGRTSGREPAGG